MGKLLPSIFGDKKAERTKLLGVYVKTMVSVLDTLRYNEFERSAVDVARIYSYITSNQTFATLCSHSSDQLVNFRPELYQFLRTRLVKLIEDMIEVIQYHSGSEDPNCNIIGPIPTCGAVINSSNTMRDLRLMEFEVLRACEHLENSCKHADSKLSNTQLTDLPSALSTWIHLFKSLSTKVKNSTSKMRAFYLPNVNNDEDSMNVIILVGHLIAHITQSILIAKTCGKVDLSACQEEVSKKLVFNEYSSYSNIGSLSIAGILCCYGRMDILPAAVLNPNGSLGIKEREFLNNLLVVSKLVS